MIDPKPAEMIRAAAYDLCVGINGSCPCEAGRARPCLSIEWMAEHGITAEMELSRMARQTRSGPATKEHKWGRED